MPSAPWTVPDGKRSTVASVHIVRSAATSCSSRTSNVQRTSSPLEAPAGGLAVAIREG